MNLTNEEWQKIVLHQARALAAASHQQESWITSYHSASKERSKLQEKLVDTERRREQAVGALKAEQERKEDLSDFYGAVRTASASHSDETDEQLIRRIATMMEERDNRNAFVKDICDAVGFGPMPVKRTEVVDRVMELVEGDGRSGEVKKQLSNATRELTSVRDDRRRAVEELESLKIQLDSLKAFAKKVQDRMGDDQTPIHRLVEKIPQVAKEESGE